MRKALKDAAFWLATLAVAPALWSFWIRRRWLGADRALEGSTQALSLIPGLSGDYLRKAFLHWTLASCDRSATIQFGTIFSQTGARIGRNVYVGPRCHLGLVALEANVLLGSGVHIPSGGATHGTADATVPIRDQPGRRSVVRIGEGSWVGNAAVILASVGCHSVVGAGAVVTKPLPDYVFAAGVPARVIRSRRPGTPS